MKRAERTGNLDGWRAWLEGSSEKLKAVVEIFRKDWKYSFTHEVYWEEAVQRTKAGNPTQFWAKQPRFQLRKVAIAQAFRIAFPDALGGMPYESAELPEQSSETINQDHSTEDLPDWVTEETDKTSTDDIQETTETQSAPTNIQNDQIDEMTRRIESLFDAHPQDFTKKHRAWIMDKVHKATDKAGIQKMLFYTEKVIKKSA